MERGTKKNRKTSDARVRRARRSNYSSGVTNKMQTFRVHPCGYHRRKAALSAQQPKRNMSCLPKSSDIVCPRSNQLTITGRTHHASMLVTSWIHSIPASPLGRRRWALACPSPWSASASRWPCLTLHPRSARGPSHAPLPARTHTPG